MISMAGKAIRRWWALFALPTFAAFIIGFLVPFIMGVYLSFCEFTTVTDGEWVGLKNYGKALKDKEFLHALGFSTAFTIVTTIVINVIAFAIAYMLTKAIKGSTLFRSVFFMPNLIGGIILGYIWLLLLNGVLAHWGRALTYKASYGFWGLVILVCWQQIGYMMIIYIAGLQALPTDVLEAAAVDGANGRQTMFRIIIPLTRDVTPDEYQAIARYFAAEWGIDQFDECSYRPHQLMYWPTTPSNGEYVCEKVEGEWLDPDVFLSLHPNWQDCSLLPTSSRESEVKENSGKKMEDPEAKGGVVGLFCRAYPIREAIDTFLSNVYEPSANIPGRYSYIPADSSAGVQIFEEKFAHSFHASDPACGRSLNSFDLVRVHKFGDEDEKKSFQAMCDFAMSLDKVRVLAAEEKKAEADMDFDDGEDWREKLRYMPRSKVLENSVFNEVLILNNDPDFQNFAFNEMANRIQITGEVPWNRPDDNKFWRDADTAQLKAILDTRYTSFSTRNHDVSFLKVADDRSFHPVRDYLDGLPSWDGKERVDTLLIDYFDADDTLYVRAVTRKMLVAAVTRIYHPGTKFDSVPVLDGKQGIGKSTFLKDLCGEEYYADNLSLTDMNDKAAAEKLQGFWIVEIPELAGMKKADIEKVKAFITTTDDKYRPSYGRTVESHPRQCVVIASVNGERGYLRDITGNRRFWVVKLKQTEQKRKWHFTQEEKDQIWAEAKKYYEEGEKLYEGKRQRKFCSLNCYWDYRYGMKGVDEDE